MSWFGRARRNREARDRFVEVRNYFTVQAAALVARVDAATDNATSRPALYSDGNLNGKVLQDFMLRQSLDIRMGLRLKDVMKIATLAGDHAHYAARDMTREIILGHDAKPALRTMLKWGESIAGMDALVEQHLSAHWEIMRDEEGWKTAEFTWYQPGPIQIHVK